MNKRIFDIVILIPLFIIIIPTLGLIYLLSLLIMGLPVIFKQNRLGLNTKAFTFYKFRTMTNNKDEKGTLLPDKDRLTNFGKFLRRTSIDELPSFINVLKGDMSLVGPRPLLMEYLDRYSSDQAHRHDVKPGITGWAQVNGRNAIIWEEKFKLDVWYVDNRSTWLDLKILFITIWKVLKGEGISQKGHATMEEFKG